jgi:integrase
MPASSDTVSLYVTWLLTVKKRKVSTATRHLSAIAWYHRLARRVSPVTPDVKEVLYSVQRARKEKPTRKAALTPEDLVRILDALDDSNAGTRDRAILLLGFASSLRRSELARLELADISFAPEGLILVVGHSKTDQHGRGRILSVWKGEKAWTDPVRAVEKWLDRRGLWDGPLFCHVERFDRMNRKSLTGEAIHDAVVRAIVRAGMDPTHYGAHSLRAGAITAAAIAGASDQEIMGLSGHANAAVMRGYIRKTRVFAGRNPLAGVL